MSYKGETTKMTHTCFPSEYEIGVHNPSSPTAISGGPCGLHPGTVHSPTAQLASSGSVRLVTPGASTLSLASSVNTKIHRVPPQSNLHSHRLSTLSKTIGLLTLQHC